MNYIILVNKNIEKRQKAFQSADPKKNKILFVFSLLLHFLCTAFLKIH